MLRRRRPFKNSLGHRLLIWDFAGERIAERPLLGWGLDSSRAIPGGKELIRPGQRRLPLHPHDAALQVWLELGLPGAVLFALLLGWLWLRLARRRGRASIAAAVGRQPRRRLARSLSAGWGVWQEWWLGDAGLAVFAIVAMARAAVDRAPGEPRYSAAAARVARLRSLMSRSRLRRRIAFGVTSTSSSSSI